MKLNEIEEKLLKIKDENDPFLLEVKKDERKGAKKLIQQWEKRRQSDRKAEEKFWQMTSYERTILSQGYKLIAGIDEVGRGPLAGPVVACAVILPENFQLLGLDDSKKLTEAKRELFYEYIKENALAIGYGIISASEIDQMNILEATKKAMLYAIHELSIEPEFLLIDAVKLPTPYPSQSIIQGDAKSISIAAASVMAKVTRDRLMKEIHNQYPQYQFNKNMGYGTKEHLSALNQYGATPFHRMSFEPIKSLGK